MGKRSLERLVHNSYEDLFSIDDQGILYDDPIRTIDLLTPRIVDGTTLSAIDVKDLFRAVDHTKTRTGAATLFRSLVRPLDSLELILEKQNSVRELRENRRLGKALIDYLGSLVKKESYIHCYLFQSSYVRDEPYDLRYIDQYKLYHESTVFFRTMVTGARKLPDAETPYMKILVEDIRSIDGTRVSDLIKGPVFETVKGLKTKKEVKLYTPRVKFTLRSTKPTLAIPYIPIFLFMYFEQINQPAQLLGMTSFLVYTSFFLSYPERFDRKHFIDPLGAIYKTNPNISKGIDALGKLDELISFHEYSRSMRGDMVLPTITHDNRHYFLAKEIRNPVLAKGNPEYVPNDVNMDEQRLTVITGANSGGKTTYCETIAQTQLLAQIGCYIPAEEARLAVADRILYQAPMFDSIVDAEGRFGTELKRTKDLFLEATPRSLVVLDELAEATTYEEKMEISYAILDGFRRIGSTITLITHNHELAERLQEEGRSQNLQVEFKNRKPTYRLLPGTAKKSHAELVAEKIGFSPRDIDIYLKRKGIG